VNEGRPVERREAQGTGIYVALTLEGKHDAVCFDRDDDHDTDDDEKDNDAPDDTDFEDEDDSDDEDESGFVEEDITDTTTTVLSKIWDEADLASPRPFEYVATRDDLEIFSQADMGNIANFQIQTYTPNPQPDDKQRDWPCIGICLSTADGHAVVLGQCIPEEIAHLHSTKGFWTSPVISAAQGISFFTTPSPSNPRHYLTVNVSPGKIENATAYVSNERNTRITWWTHRDGVRIGLTNA
jgi:hypothetical protein